MQNLFREKLNQNEKRDDRQISNIEEIIRELASGKEAVNYSEICSRIFPEKQPVNAREVADCVYSLSDYIRGHKRIDPERNAAVELKAALLDRVFNEVNNLPPLDKTIAEKAKVTDERSLKEFITSFSARYEDYVREELRGKWRNCGDASRLFSAIMRGYISNLEVALISADVYILSSGLKKILNADRESVIIKVKEEIKRIQEKKSAVSESENLRKECGHLALRACLGNEAFIIDPTQKQFDSTLEVFSVYKEKDIVDGNGIIRLAKNEKGRLLSGQLTGADILTLIEHEDIIS